MTDPRSAAAAILATPAACRCELWHGLPIQHPDHVADVLAHAGLLIPAASADQE